MTGGGVRTERFLKNRTRPEAVVHDEVLSDGAVPRRVPERDPRCRQRPQLCPGRARPALPSSRRGRQGALQSGGGAGRCGLRATPRSTASSGAPAAPERPGGDSRCSSTTSASRAAASRPRPGPLVGCPRPRRRRGCPRFPPAPWKSGRRRARGEAPVLLRLRSAPSRAELSLRRPRR